MGVWWRSLLDTFSVFEEGETYSEKDAVPAVVRDRGVGGGAGGSCRGPIDVVESSAEESTGILSLGLRESGMVSTRRSAASTELLEVGLCAVISRGRWTPVDVRRRDCWVGYGYDAGGRWPWRSGSGAGEGMYSAVSSCRCLSREIGEMRRNSGNGRHGAVSRIDGGRKGEHRGRARRALPPLPKPQTNRLNKGANPWPSG